MKLSHLIIIFAAINIAGCTLDSTQEKTVSTSNFDLYGAIPEVTLYSKAKLRGDAARKLELFRITNGYYGAFAYSPRVGLEPIIIAPTNRNSLKSAIDDALIGCSALIKNGDEPCKIIAVMTPKGYENKQKLTLNYHNTQILKKMRNKKQFKAFAISDRGSSVHFSGKKTQEIANRAALDACNSNEKTMTNRLLKVRPCYLIPEAQ